MATTVNAKQSPSCKVPQTVPNQSVDHQRRSTAELKTAALITDDGQCPRKSRNKRQQPPRPVKVEPVSSRVQTARQRPIIRRPSAKAAVDPVRSDAARRCIRVTPDPTRTKTQHRRRAERERCHAPAPASVSQRPKTRPTLHKGSRHVAQNSRVTNINALRKHLAGHWRGAKCRGPKTVRVLRAMPSQIKDRSGQRRQRVNDHNPPCQGCLRSSTETKCGMDDPRVQRPYQEPMRQPRPPQKPRSPLALARGDKTPAARSRDETRRNRPPGEAGPAKAPRFAAQSDQALTAITFAWRTISGQVHAILDPWPRHEPQLHRMVSPCPLRCA